MRVFELNKHIRYVRLGNYNRSTNLFIKEYKEYFRDSCLLITALKLFLTNYNSIMYFRKKIMGNILRSIVINTIC